MSSLLALQNHKYPAGAAGSPVSIALNGTTDYLERNSDFTSDVDSTKITFYAKVGASSAGVIIAASLGYFTIEVIAGRLKVQLKNTVGTVILAAETVYNGPQMDDGTTREIMISFDGVAGTVAIYIDGVLDANTPYATTTTGTVELTRGNWALGALTNGTTLFPGNMTRVALFRDVALDLSVLANRNILADETDTASVGGTLLQDTYTTSTKGAFDNQAGTGTWTTRNGGF